MEYLKTIGKIFVWIVGVGLTVWCITSLIYQLFDWVRPYGPWARFMAFAGIEAICIGTGWHFVWKPAYLTYKAQEEAKNAE